MNTKCFSGTSKFSHESLRKSPVGLSVFAVQLHTRMVDVTHRVTSLLLLSSLLLARGGVGSGGSAGVSVLSLVLVVVVLLLLDLVCVHLRVVSVGIVRVGVCRFRFVSVGSGGSFFTLSSGTYKKQQTIKISEASGSETTTSVWEVFD